MEITVLLPTYNSEKTISVAIMSILSQTFKDYEFLIIDDGSTDNTEKIVKSFDDKRIKYIKKKHTGLADTLNYGLKIAKFDWVARMDADDISHPNRLQEQIKFISSNNTIIYSMGAYFIDNRILYIYDTPKDITNFKENFILHSPIPHPSIIYNKNFILDNGGYNSLLKAFEDYELWLKLMNKANFKIVSKYLIFQRIRKESLSHSYSKSNNRIIYNIQANYYKNISYYFGVKNRTEQNKYHGWREYFFGDPALARNYWGKSFLTFLNLRIIMAFLITFLPIRFIAKFKQSNIKMHLKYYLKIMLGKNKLVEKAFKESLDVIYEVKR